MIVFYSGRDRAAARIVQQCAGSTSGAMTYVADERCPRHIEDIGGEIFSVR
jgi:hypothetical protein